MHRWRLVISAFIVTCSLSVSCSVTRNIPEGEYLLQKIEVVSDREAKEGMIPSSQIERYVRQSPNRKIFNFSFYLWVYNLANPEKDNWWNNLKRSVGEEPIYYNEEQTFASEENIKIYLDSQGYYASEVDVVVDTLSKSHAARVSYIVKQNKPYIIESLSYDVRDSLLVPLILADSSRTLIKRGEVFSVTLLEKERERITSRLRNRGYYDFSIRNIEFLADTLDENRTVKLEMIVNQTIRDYAERGKPNYSPNSRYIISDINVVAAYDPSVVINNNYLLNNIDTLRYKGLNIIYEKGRQPNVRPKVLRQMIPFEEGDFYSSQRVEQTYENLMSLGYFRSARIAFHTTQVDEPTGDSLLQLSLARRSARISGAGIKSPPTMNAPIGYLSNNILCTPALKQSYDIELEGSTTSSFYGLYTTVGYQNRNIFRGAEAWNIELKVGYENMKAPDALKRRAIELGATSGFDFPRFILPFTDRLFLDYMRPQTNVEFSVSWQDRPYYTRVLSSASWGYSWRNRGNSSFMLRPIDINVIDMHYIDEDYLESLTNDYLRNSYQTQLIAGVSLGYVYNNQKDHIGGNATILRFNAETSGNLINGFELLCNSPQSDGGYYEILGIRYAQYFRTDLDISRKIMLSSKVALAGRLYGGVGIAYNNSSAVPFDRLFYSGGSNSMRGWTPRTLGPGVSTINEDDAYPSQVGDMKLEANLELRFPIWGMIHGATFLDAGNIWYLKDSEGIYDSSSIFSGSEFYKQLGFNTGVGIRIDIQFAVLRLDWGIQIHNPNMAEGSRWVIKDFKFENSALNFGVGYPF